MNLSNYLEANKCIDDNRWNKKNRHPCHELPKTCGGRKSVYLVWIRPTDNLVTHPRRIFRINECQSNRYDTYKPGINKISLGWRTWWIFYTKKINKSKWTSMNTQLAPSPQPSTNLRGKKIRPSGLDMYHIQFSNTTKDKFWYQWKLIRPMRKIYQQSRTQRW